MRHLATTAVLLAGVLWTSASSAHHYDIAPYFQGGQLLTGGRDHFGSNYAPPIYVYGYDFGEDEFDPFNPADPGVNQGAGVGSLPAGAAVRYDILSSLLYWDGAGEVAWGAPPGDVYLTLLMGAQGRTLTGTSGPQAGSSVQTVLADGSVHRHFTTSLYNAPGTSNIPGAFNYEAPPEGMYAFSLSLTLTEAGTPYTSAPVWIVFNNNLTEAQHEAAIVSLVPEPAAWALAVCGLAAAAVFCRRKPQ